MKPKLAFFAPQFLQLMQGNKGINTLDDVCRFAADSGYTGIDLPIGMIDVTKMIEDPEYRGQEIERFRALGTPIIRLSSHVTGQLGSLPRAYMCRFSQFASEGQRDLNRDGLEKAAHKEIRNSFILSKLLGITHHQTFPGGRGVPHHDQWSTLPKNWNQYRLMWLALQWTDTFKIAVENDVNIGFEIGHVMEEIQSVRDLELFRSYLPEELRANVSWGVDTSHFDKEQDSGSKAVAAAIAAGLATPGHAKDAFFDINRQGGRHRQHGLPFAEQAGVFEVFGMGTPESAKAFVEVLKLAEKQGKFDWAVVEGEAMRQIRCPFQGMKIAAENIRRIHGGEEPLTYEEIQVDPWGGNTFETFAETNVTVSELLELKQADYLRLCALAELHGVPRP